MAKMKCPSCGQPFNGKRCRNCMYEVFTEEITHGLHTHEGEPLVIDAPQRRPIRRKNPFVWDKRTRRRNSASPLVGVAVALVIALAVPLAGQRDQLEKEWLQFSQQVNDFLQEHGV